MIGGATSSIQRRGVLERILGLPNKHYERASAILTSNGPIENWGKVLGDTAAVTAMLDRLLHHAHVLKTGPRSRRTHENGIRSTNPMFPMVVS